MPYLFDRVRETTTTTGTGTVTLAGAVTGYRSFGSVLSNGDTCYYVIEDVTSGAWECGVGTYSTSGTTLARTTVTASSNANALVSFAAGTKYVFIDSTAANIGPTYGNNYFLPPMTPGGRLTLTSGTPVTTSDVTGSNTVYYAPYLHNVCPLWDGTRWQQVVFSGPTVSTSPVSQTTRSCTVTSGSKSVTLSSGNTTGLYVGQLLTGSGVTTFGNYVTSIDTSTTFSMSVAGTSSLGSTVTFYAPNYDVFGYLSSGVMALEALSWTDNTTRATALAVQDGRYVKSGDPTRLYLGSYRMNATTQTADTIGLRFLWNMYNRVDRPLYKQEATTSWTYTSAAWRPFNNSISNRVEFFNGLSETNAFVILQAGGTNASGATGLVGLGLDSTNTATYLSAIGGGGYAYFTVVTPGGAFIPGIGYHYIQALESGFTGCTFYGTSACNSSITGQLTN